MRPFAPKSLLIAFLTFTTLQSPLQSARAQEITPDATANTAPSDNLTSIVERPDEDLLIFELRIGTILLSEALITYEDLDTGKYYIPLTDFVDSLEFPINVNNNDGTAKGWSLSEKDTFLLSLPDKTAIISAKKIALQKGDIENHSDGIYVSLKTLESWFPITIDVDFSNLALVIKSLKPLPLENRLERDKDRNKIGPKKQQTTRTTPVEKPEAPYFTRPFVDTSIQTSYTNSDDAEKSFSTDYSLTARNIILNQDALYTLNDSTTDKQDPDIRFTIGRKALGEDKLFLGLTEYALGDVTTSDHPLIAKSSAGRGAFLTNVSSFESSFSGSDTITLRGELPLGYQVDIKRNGELLDFVDERDENGEYVFTDLFVLSGLNVFELVFYGPQGQKYKEEKRIFVPQNPTKKGAFEYRVQTIQDNTNLFTNRNNQDEDTGKLRLTAEASYGLSSISSIRAGAATYSLDGQRKNFALAGFSTSFKGVRFDTNGAINDDGHAASVRLQSTFKGFRWQALHEAFSDFTSETTENSGLSGELEHKSELRISGILPFLFLRSTPLTLQAERLQNTDGDERYEWRLRATKNIKRLRFTTELEQAIQEQNDRQTNLNIQVSSRLKYMTLRGTVNYAIEPDLELETINLTSDIKINPTTKARVGLIRSGTEDTLHSLSLGLNKDFGTFLAGVNTTYDDDGDFSALLSASFGFAYNPRTGKPYFSAHRLSEASAIIARPFDDKNADRIKNENEEYLENIGFSVPRNKKEFITNQQGEIFIPGLRTYEHAAVEILHETFPNPFMQSEPRKIDYLMRPSQIATRNYPVTLTGQVDGDVSIFKKATNVPAASIKLDIFSAEGTKITSGKTEFDGFFFIENVPMGTHIIQPSSEQLTELGYCPVNPQNISLESEEPFFSIAHPFVLHPKPGLIEQNRWIILKEKLLPAVAQKQASDPYDKIFNTETSLDTGEDIKVAYDLMPRFILPYDDTNNLQQLVSGPYTDLQSLKTCDLLKKNNYTCLSIKQLSCDDLEKLKKAEITDNSQTLGTSHYTNQATETH